MRIQPQPKGDKIEHTPIPAGTYTLRLTVVNEYERENKFKGGLKEPRLAWVYEAEGTIDPLTQKPYEYAEFTGVSYGYELARLTAILDWMLPEVEPEFRENVETDSMIGRRFRSRIQMKKNEDGTTRPQATFMEPVAEETDENPFPPMTVVPPPKAVAVTDTQKVWLGTAFQIVPETIRGTSFKAAFGVELGRLGYPTYGDFLARGGKDVDGVLAFVSGWATPVADEVPF